MSARKWVTMMFWYGHDPGGWGWFAMSVGMVVFWALLIAIAVLLSRALSQPSGSKASTGPEQPGAAAEQFLAERFARGQIEEDEYLRRPTVLRDGGNAPSGTK
ncbi:MULTISPECIES: SHOCT domain-containing protein [unclassified Streptomyces]|uniref:SHOCT domain-containing protein n=1 Tax=unclassified Streptomyces TaxID=2593676 RepID=UPI002FF1280D